MLETIREFGLEQLEASGEADATRQQHAAFFRDLTEAAEPQLRGPQQRLWLDRLEAEHDNFRQALAWALTHELEMALRLAGPLFWLWSTRGHRTEGRRWLEQVAERCAGVDHPSALAKVLWETSVLTWFQGDVEPAGALAERSLTLARESGARTEEAFALLTLGGIAFTQGSTAEGITHAEAARTLFTELGDAWGVSMSLQGPAYAAGNSGDVERMEVLLDEALRHARQAGAPAMIALVTGDLGSAAEMRGDLKRAETLRFEALEMSKEVGDAGPIAEGVLSIADLARKRGDLQRALAWYREGLIASRDLGDKEFVAWGLDGVAQIAAQCGQAEQAATLFGAAGGLLPRGEMPPDQTDPYPSCTAVAREHLGEAAFAAAWAKGHEWPLETALGNALAVMDEVGAALVEGYSAATGADTSCGAAHPVGS
jgi:tetratricopeptide (TPR) repeat protein